jgi:hypothetical protein
MPLHDPAIAALLNIARMAEQVDAVDSKSTAGNGVRVRLSLRAPKNSQKDSAHSRILFSFGVGLGVHIGVYRPFLISHLTSLQFFLIYQVYRLKTDMVLWPEIYWRICDTLS